MLPLPFRQEPWVLQSASADQPNPPQNNYIQPEAKKAYAIASKGLNSKTALQEATNNLVLARVINQDNPNNLTQIVPNWPRFPNRKNIAFLLPGELRCLERSRPLINTMKKYGDLFICTNSSYEKAALDLNPIDLAIIENNSTLQSVESSLPVGSMMQWHKLAICCQLMLQNESRRGRPYTHLVKVRSDYFYLQPQFLIKELLELKNDPYSGLIGCSDKVFAGPRHLMLLLQGFWQALSGHFLDKSKFYWPLNLSPILKGDDSAKWYGLGFPKRLVGDPETVEELRRTLIQGGPTLLQAISQPWQPDEPLINFFPGHPRFPSEVAFARFLNFNGIPLRSTPGLRGFLYSDRSG